MKTILKDWAIEIIILIIAIILVFLNPSKVGSSLISATKTYLNLLPIIISVVLLSSLISVTVSKEKIKKIIGKRSGLIGILVGAIFGTLMVGPAYVFYPFFKELRDKGAGANIIATTIGAWAIKVPWIPFAITILGWKFTLLFNGLIFLFAIISGIFVGAFFKE
ncbi:MAG: permease [Caldisericia bacterium]